MTLREGGASLKGEGGGASKGGGASRLKGRGFGRERAQRSPPPSTFDLPPPPPLLPATLERRSVGPKPRKSGGPKGGGPKGGGPKGGGPKGGGPKGGGPKGGGPKGGGPEISRFFFPSPPQNSFFPLWGSSRGILVVFEAPGRSNVHVWSSRVVV